MSDVQGSASLDVAQVVAGLRQLKTGIDSITNGMTVLNQKGDQVKRTLKDTFKDSAQAAGKMGGPLGSWSSKLFGGASMGDGFGRIAVGLSLATVGFRAYQSVVDAAIERTRMFVAAQKEVRDIADQTDKAMDSMAKRGEAQAESRLKVIAFGKNAESDADMMASDGLMSQQEANEAAAILYGRFGDSEMAKAGVDTVMRGAHGGLDPIRVAKELIKHGNVLTDSSQSDSMLGWMAMEDSGAQGDPEEIWKNRMSNFKNSPYAQAVWRNRADRSGIPGLERSAFMTAGLGAKDAAQAANPQAFFENEAFKKFSQSVEDLKKMAEAQGPAARILADVFQPGGSFQTQLDRMINANAEARGLKSDAGGFNPNQTFPTGPYDPRGFGPFGR